MASKEEAEILDDILLHGHEITCFNCGEALTDVFKPGKPVAVLWVDPGRINYPREPDEPAEAYFECWKCFQKRFQKEVEG